MKLYNSVGPNPHVVRMFMAERGADAELISVDLRGGENRREDFLKINPAGQLPALETDTGEIITEITVICEYLDEVTPGHKLMGDTPEERAQNRRWVRWVDLNIAEAMGRGFRYSEGLQLFKDRMRVIPEAAEGLKADAQDKLEWLDKRLAGEAYVAGEKFSLADILLFCFLAFGAAVGQPLNPEFKNLAAWFERVGSRASAKA